MSEPEPISTAELQRRRRLVADARSALDAVGLPDAWTSSWIDSLAQGGPGLDINPKAPAQAEEVLRPFISQGLVVQRRQIVLRLD